MHELLVVRHAIARDRLKSMGQGMDDTDRPLTAEGRRKMALAARGLKQLHQEIDTILTSPLLRAQQTAQILSDHYPASRVTVCKPLSPDYNSATLIRALNEEPGKRIAIVGHEPGLSALITTLIYSKDSGAIQLKKGGVAQLQFNDNIASGKGTLQWLLTPKQLRLLGKNA
jgi:phosphohistidine phosphatase